MSYLQLIIISSAWPQPDIRRNAAPRPWEHISRYAVTIIPHNCYDPVHRRSEMKPLFSPMQNRAANWLSLIPSVNGSQIWWKKAMIIDRISGHFMQKLPYWWRNRWQPFYPNTPKKPLTNQNYRFTRIIPDMDNNHFEYPWNVFTHLHNFSSSTVNR